MTTRPWTETWESAFATWDPAMATDEPDGYPDRAIVPLVEELRKRGVMTLQSCVGHPGSYDGKLWVAGLTESEVRPLLRGPFTSVKHTIFPTRRWEFEWNPDDAEEAMEVLRTLALRTARTLDIPTAPDESVVLTGRFPLTDEEWENFQTVLSAMRPGVVR